MTRFRPAPTPPAPPAAGPRAVPATAAVLLALLLAVNGVAIWGILSVRESVEEEAVRDLGVTTAAQARALEAALASLAGDVIFLSQAPALVGAPEAMASDDPMVVRWARLGAEGGLLLFLESHDEVERAVARTADGRVLVAVGRREGAPIVLPPETAEERRPPQDLHVGRWPLGPRESPAGSLEVWIEPERLLAGALPGAGDDLEVRRLPVPRTAVAEPFPEAVPEPLVDGAGGGYSVRMPDPEGGDDRLAVSALVLDQGWNPPLRWDLVHRVRVGELAGSFDVLASRYRTTLGVNLGVVTLTLVLGFLAIREVRRSARLAAENAQQARVRELERQVMHSERLAGVGRLAAGMAHEINNPLEGMSNYLRLLEDDLEHGDVEGARALAGRVREGLDRAAGITRQVLEYSDPGRGPKRVLDLRRVVADAVDFVRESGAFPGTELTLAVPGEPLPVRANPTTLGQLFLNLLLNACEAQPRDGRGEEGRVEVTLVPAVGEGTAGREGRHRPSAAMVPGGRPGREAPALARVHVADRGPGIPEDALPHLFEPFFSTRGSTGLGLAVCHGVVTDHGGRLHAANRPGGGAAFTVELPLAPAAEATKPPGDPKPVQGTQAGRRVAVVGSEGAGGRARVGGGEAREHAPSTGGDRG